MTNEQQEENEYMRASIHYTKDNRTEVCAFLCTHAMPGGVVGSVAFGIFGGIDIKAYGVDRYEDVTIEENSTIHAEKQVESYRIHHILRIENEASGEKPQIYCYTEFLIDPEMWFDCLRKEENVWEIRYTDYSASKVSSFLRTLAGLSSMIEGIHRDFKTDELTLDLDGEKRPLSHGTIRFELTIDPVNKVKTGRLLLYDEEDNCSEFSRTEALK